MPGDNGGAIIIHGHQQYLSRNSKTVLFDNQSETLDKEMTEEEVVNTCNTFGHSGGEESAYLLVWGFGT